MTKSGIQDDEDNPWRWIGTAIVGQPSEVIIADRFGTIQVSETVVLLDDGFWYRLEPPVKLGLRPVAWRYKMIATN